MDGAMDGDLPHATNSGEGVMEELARNPEPLIESIPAERCTKSQEEIKT